MRGIACGVLAWWLTPGQNQLRVEVVVMVLIQGRRAKRLPSPWTGIVLRAETEMVVLIQDGRVAGARPSEARVLIPR